MYLRQRQVNELTVRR